MLLAAAYLLIWDLRSLQVLIRDEIQISRLPLKVMDSTYWTWLGTMMLATIAVLALFNPNLFLELAVPFVEGLVGFILFFVLKRRNVARMRSVSQG
jgi:hypothetical protein